jgi:hypothetical protein
MNSTEAHDLFDAAQAAERRYARHERDEPGKRHHWREQRWRMIDKATELAGKHDPKECTRCQA